MEIKGLETILKWEHLGTVAYFCNPSYSGGRDQEDHSLRPVQAKNLQGPISTNEKLSVVMHTCHPSYVGSTNKRIVVQARPGK
jgi:hypothetical protein